MFASNTSQVSSDATYIEDVFSTYLYTGNGSTQTITNGIDLAGKGGLIWTKARSSVGNNYFVDTANGISNWLASNLTNALTTTGTDITSVSSTGYSLNDSVGGWNNNTRTFASWTFRKQPKFFDVVTYTGNGSNRTISHSLGSVPGCIIVKRTDTTGDWQVYHRSLANTEYTVLNTTAAKATGATRWNSTTPTTTEFSLGTDTTVNASGGTYVAHLFAHDAGGFGLTGTDNVITCGSYTGTGTAGLLVTLGYEPQWILVKDVTTAGWDWYVIDNMRGFIVNPASPNFTKSLSPNTTSAESDQTAISPTATGFRLNSGAGAFNSSGDTYIYIAIRRGPMKTPTTGTSVYTGVTQAASTEYSVGFPADLVMAAVRSGNAINTSFGDRLRGKAQYLVSSSTADEATNSPYIFDFNTSQNGIIPGFSSSSSIYWNFRRAPGFFDEVCYKGTSSVQNVTHNLTVAPEIIIVKKRDSALTSDWFVYSASLGNGQRLRINSSSGSASTTAWNSTNPTATQWTMDGSSEVNETGYNFAAYLFASCPGVSKVGSYTGDGTTGRVIDCGFTGGARFILIKRTDSTGDWYVWDTARGIVSSNDPRLSLNSTAAEVTSDDTIDTTSSGFIVNQRTATNVNVSGGTYIYLAIA